MKTEKTEEKPRFLLAAEELARQRGTDAQEILRRNREAVRNFVYPGPDCLLPDEIESFFADLDGIEAGRAEHARNCAGCSALLASAGVDPAELERILEGVKIRAQTLPTAVPGTGRPEDAESHLSKKAKWGLATLGSVFAFGSILSFFKLKRRSPHPMHTAPDP